MQSDPSSPLSKVSAHARHSAIYNRWPQQNWQFRAVTSFPPRPTQNMHSGNLSQETNTNPTVQFSQFSCSISREKQQSCNLTQETNKNPTGQITQPSFSISQKKHAFRQLINADKYNHHTSVQQAQFFIFKRKTRILTTYQNHLI